MNRREDNRGHNNSACLAMHDWAKDGRDVPVKSMTTSFCSEAALRMIAWTSSADSGSSTAPPRIDSIAGNRFDTPKIVGRSFVAALVGTGVIDGHCTGGAAKARSLASKPTKTDRRVLFPMVQFSSPRVLWKERKVGVKNEMMWLAAHTIRLFRG